MTTSSPDSFYSISDPDAQRTYVGVRRAAHWVGFFLPHLRPGFALLDCGCGVGSITLDLAEQVAPGPVIGVDRDEGQLAVARAAAQRRGLTNVTFETGDVYRLRFDADQFDAVLAHTLLYHLPDQARALREIRRVLKPGGVAGVSDDDFSTARFAPELPAWRTLFDLWARVVQHNGGDPYYSPRLRGLMLEAGFAATEGYAVAADHYGTLDETRRWGQIVSGIIRSPDFSHLVTTSGWITPEALAALPAEIERWAEAPDAFYAVMYCAAVGWK